MAQIISTSGNIMDFAGNTITTQGGKTYTISGRDTITSGTEITLADNTEYRLEDVSTLTLTYPEGNFEAWIRLTTAAEGAITITLPTSSYIGDAPSFGNGETWEISIKDGVVIAGKAVSAI